MLRLVEGQESRWEWRKGFSEERSDWMITCVNLDRELGSRLRKRTEDTLLFCPIEMFGEGRRKMSLFSKIKNVFKKDKPVITREGIPIPPPKTAASFTMMERGYHTCVWLENWVEYTKGDGVLAFPEHGTFNVRMLANLRN